MVKTMVKAMVKKVLFFGQTTGIRTGKTTGKINGKSIGKRLGKTFLQYTRKKMSKRTIEFYSGFCTACKSATCDCHSPSKRKKVNNLQAAADIKEQLKSVMRQTTPHFIAPPISHSFNTYTSSNCSSASQSNSNVFNLLNQSSLSHNDTTQFTSPIQMSNSILNGSNISQFPPIETFANVEGQTNVNQF